MRSTSKKQNTDFQYPGVVFQPQVHEGLLKGVNLLVNTLRPTLGPLPRLVGSQRILTDRPPELLDSGGTIARRIPQITGRNADMGAMFVRHALWQIQDKVGDGTTTAGILLQSIYNQGIAYLSSGGNAMRLRYYLEISLPTILKQITRFTIPISGKEKLANFAETICYDKEISQALGEAFNILGPYGRLEVRSGRGREVSVEYVQGIYWEEGVLNPAMIEDFQNFRTVITDAAVLATDLDVNDAEETLHLLDLTASSGINGVLLIANSINDSAMAPLLEQRNRNKVKVLAVKTPGNFPGDQMPSMTDLAMITGGRPILKMTNATLKSLTLGDFGQTRRAWASRDTFGIHTGQGDPREIRQYVYRLQKAYQNADNVTQRLEIEKRVGRLMNGSVTVWIGALSEDEFERRNAMAYRAGRALRSALLEGVVPGGGASLLSCRAALEKDYRLATDPDHRAALRILLRALEEPFRVLMWNAGFDGGRIGTMLGKVRTNHVYDLLYQRYVNPYECGLFDSAGVIKSALHSAISSAALLLTTDVLVHLKNPPEQPHT